MTPDDAARRLVDVAHAIGSHFDDLTVRLEESDCDVCLLGAAALRLEVRLRELVAALREREHARLRLADDVVRTTAMQAKRLAAEAEGLAYAADKLDQILASDEATEKASDGAD